MHMPVQGTASRGAPPDARSHSVPTGPPDLMQSAMVIIMQHPRKPGNRVESLVQARRICETAEQRHDTKDS